MLQYLIDMLYPVRCPVCREIVVPKGQRICGGCRDKLRLIEDPRCKKCSKPVEFEEQEYCSDCERKTFQYVRGFSVWVYDSVMKDSIADYKYRNKKENAKFYLEELVRHYGEAIRKLAPDALVPVPIHRSKYKVRGYNQADILARGIGKQLGIPVMSELLVRVKKTLPQKQLDDKERLENLKKAFCMNLREADRYDKRLNRILLVDDIYTTGSTVEACTGILLEYGVEEVYFVTLCIGRGY